MRTTALAVMLGVLMSGAADARAAGHEPSYERIRAGLARGAVASPPVLRAVAQMTADAPVPAREAPPAAGTRRNRPQTNGRDTVWNGLLIGAGIGAGGGYLWARDVCGSNDSECLAIAAPAGVLGGAGIGAAAGALLDWLQRSREE